MSSSKLTEKLKAYKIFSNDCIFFKTIFTEHDLDNKNTTTNVFRPEFTHQIFGDDETIFGYKNLKINYYLTPGAMHGYIGLDYSDRITPQRYDGIEADDVYDAFQKFGCSPGFTRNLDTFCANKLKSDFEFKPYGVKIHEYTLDSSQSKFEIYKVDSTCNQYHSQKFIDYLLRVETMLIFFIETANFTDTDDDQWTFYFLYEKRKHLDHERYVTIGFLSLYNYYAYPDKTRVRISQMLIMPTYQHAGHGARLLDSIYTDVRNDPKITDITTEAPSDDFMKLRDYVTCCLCMKLDSFKNSNKLKQQFTPEMAAEALKVYKIPKLQSRRCYEILRLRATNEENADELRQYRLDIKKRLYIPFIQRKKCARNAGNVEYNGKSSNEKSNIESTSNSFSSRYFDNGTTTIGFGNGSSSSSSFSNGSKSVTIDINGGKKSALVSRLNGASSSTTNGFGSSGSSGSNGFTSTNGNKNGNSKIRFDMKVTTFNNKNSSYEDEDDYEDVDDDEDEDGSANTSLTNLYINENDRKIYLEKQFQQILVDYKSIIKRLDNH